MKTPELTFDETTHGYYLGGVKLPSVTQIMRPLYDFSQVNPDVLKRAGEFGTAVHKTIELYLADDLDDEGLDENLRGPLQAFKSWQRAYGYQGLEVERRMASKRMKYAGTADLILDGYAIIDIKTRPFSLLTDPVQLVAYEKLWLEWGGKRSSYEHRVLELKQDGTFVYTRANQKQAWPLFQMLLDRHKMDETIKKYKENTR